VQTTPPDRSDYPEEVRIVRRGGREFVLVGTAHVSRESTDLVRRVIETERPDRVCVELDEPRHQALSQRTRWENMNLRQIIRRKQLPTLLANLLLGSYQKKIGQRLGVIPGAELLEATVVADDLEIPYSLCDRNIRVTMLRAWRSMSLLQKWKLLAAMLASLLTDDEISEEDLRRLRDTDVLSELLDGLARGLPTLKRVLVDERDTYLAEMIRRADGAHIVAVIGAGHLDGVTRLLEQDGASDVESINEIPKTAPVWKYVGWGIPALIVSGLLAVAWTKGAPVAGQNLVYWILANGIPSGLGAVLALAHPLTIVIAFLCAPLTSLTPVIGAGYVTAFVQAYLQPPLVRDFQTALDDASVMRRWWSNRLLKVFLAFLFPTIGSVIGTYVGGYEIYSTLF